MDREAKERYLQEQVIDKGIDPASFQEFCEGVKGEGMVSLIQESDIDKWTLEEIIQLVNQYKLENEQPFNFDYNCKETAWDAQPWDQFDQAIQPVEGGPISNIAAVGAASFIAVGQFQAQQIGNSNSQQYGTTIGLQQQQQQYSDLEFDLLDFNTNQKPLEQQQQLQQQTLKSTTQPQPQPQQQPTTIVQQQPITQKESSPTIPTTTPTQIQILPTPNQTIVCKKLGNNIFANTRLDIQITGTQTREGGLLKSSYVLYTICTNNQYHVMRRFSDFVWLRSTLHKIFPGVGLPALSDKTMSKTSSETVNKRIVQLEYFLRELAAIDVFKNSKYYVDFLRVEDVKQFKELVKFGEKLQRPSKFENILNMTGTVNFLVDAKVGQYEQILNAQEPIYLRIKDAFKCINIQLAGVSKLLVEVQDHFNQLMQIQKVDEYAMLGEVSKKLEQSINEQNQRLYHRLYNMFRYQCSNFSQIKTVLKQRHDIQVEVQNRKDIRLDHIQDLLVPNEKISKYDELDIPSKNSKILVQQLAFLNWRSLEEINQFHLNRVDTFNVEMQKLKL